MLPEDRVSTKSASGHNKYIVRQSENETAEGSTILYFPIAHNSLCLPPKFCINYCCEMLLGGLHIPKSISQQ